MSDYNIVKQDLQAAMLQFERLIAGNGPGALTDLLRERLTLVQSANAYLAYFGRQVGAAGIHAKDDARVEPWREGHDALLALRLRYSEHISRWSAADIVARWGDYQASSHALLRAMRAHLESARHYPALPR